jgi:hypothetical protein
LIREIVRFAKVARNIPCTFGEHMGLGGRPVLPKIVFDEGVHWSGRVNFPGVSFMININALRTASAKFSTASAAGFRI